MFNGIPRTLITPSQLVSINFIYTITSGSAIGANISLPKSTAYSCCVMFHQAIIEYNITVVMGRPVSKCASYPFKRSYKLEALLVSSGSSALNSSSLVELEGNMHGNKHQMILRHKGKPSQSIAKYAHQYNRCSGNAY